MKFKVVSERPGSQSASACRSCVSRPTSWTAIVCYIGYFFPLWDAKRQTLADKIMTTVCVPLDPQAPPPQQ